jgi:predicted lysophospholipase L1 biosynthesis ABC-type transport system permease subunit
VLLRAGDREEPTFLLSFSSGPGAVAPVMTTGRAPAGPAEIAVDRAMLDLLDLEIGSAVAVVTQSGAHDFLVVGTVVLPIDRTDAFAGRSGVITFDGFLALLPAAKPNFLAVDLDEGFPPYELVDSLRQAGFRVTQGEGLEGLDPSELVSRSIGDSEQLPLVLGAVMSFAAVGVLVHLLAVGSRARRHELGILRSLGFVRRQLTGAVAVQALVLIGCALVVGVPLGIAFGRLSWIATADRLGIVAENVVPVAALAGVVACSLLAGMLAAVVPAWAASRVPTAEVLRAE